MSSFRGLGALSLLALTTSAFAAGPRADEVIDRDVNQQQRIEQGLQSGALTTREAGSLERGEARIERTEAKDLANNGKLSPAEQARINRMQNRESTAIAADKHNARVGNPNSASSERMQADVARNLNQQKRIEQGADSGALTNREVASLEAGQAHVDRVEGRAAADGHVGPAEQAHVQHAESRQSRRIYREKHN
jgi:uncharacterized iron-regulated protein